MEDKNISMDFHKAGSTHKGMKAVIVGSGSAVPDPDRGNPSQAVIVDDDILLFDCGERTTVNLLKAGVNPVHYVDYLFFTHLHRDHMADYGYLVMTTWQSGRTKPLKIFGPPGTREMSDAMIFGAFKTDIDYVRQYIKALPPHITHKPQASPLIEVQDINTAFTYETDRFRVFAGEVEHHQRCGVYSIGYRVESDYGVVAISGDTRPCQSMVELARGADILIHDTAFLDEIIEERQMWSHSGPSGAGKIAQAAGVKKLILTHLGPYRSAPATAEMASMYYGPRRGPEIWDKIVEDARRQFSGPVLLAEDGLVIKIDS
jgi:ribonuclease Z